MKHTNMLYVLSTYLNSLTRELKSQGGKCQPKESKEKLIKAIDGENVEDDLLDSPPIFDG